MPLYQTIISHDLGIADQWVCLSSLIFFVDLFIILFFNNIL